MRLFLNSIFFIIILSIIFKRFVHHLPVVAAKNSINRSPEYVLNNTYSTVALYSADAGFALGALSTNAKYLGIYFTGDHSTNATLVWVANRDTPLMDQDVGFLTIDDSGSLKFVSDNGTTLITVFHNEFGTGNNTRAVLRNSGNLIVYDATNNQTLWQSFDYPTDILLPGMKLGYNLTSKQNWTLNSWLSDQIPATGAFTMRLEQYQNSPQLLIYRRGELYWASGPWINADAGFKYIDNTMYYLSLFHDASGMYVTNLRDDFHKNPELFISLGLSRLGKFIDTTMSVILQQDGFCYGYESNDGCTVYALPSCRHQNDTFQSNKGDWTAGNYILDYDGNSSISVSDCMERCWNKCTCIGFSTNDDGTGCYTYAGDQPFQRDDLSNARTKYHLKTVVSQNPPKGDVLKETKPKKTWIRIVVPVVIILTSLSIVLLYYLLICRRKHEDENKVKLDLLNQLARSDSFNFGNELEKGIKDAPDVKVFSLKAIMDATDNFSEENKLGQGGYGPVYKGRLSDGREFAVKRLSNTSRQGMDEFKTELILISKLQHTNLVRLYGCCIHNEEKMLIYEFMPNKSLDFFLFDEEKKYKIDWHIRFNIIEGIAQGLLYLHKYSRMKIIHRDLKVSNVLLDDDMNPKIADFGLARIFQHNVTEEMTKRVAGTFGYMAPEYAMRGTFSIKSDVFSFGVLILEIVSGKRNSKFHNVVKNAWELWKREATLELKDEALGESYDVKQLLRAIHIGLLCVQENANDRPRMQEVIYALNNEIVNLPIPKQPGFFSQPDEGQSSEHLLGNYIQVSENSLTVTIIEAR